MVELVVRLVFSLAVVLGMLMLLTRLSAKKFRGGADALVRVVHRQALSRTSAVAVVTVGSRVLVVGTTEHQVQLLTELDPEELELPAEVPLASTAVVTEPTEAWEFSTLDELFEPKDDSALAGSILSAHTWKQAFAAATNRPRGAS